MLALNGESAVDKVVTVEALVAAKVGGVGDRKKETLTELL